MANSSNENVQTIPSGMYLNKANGEDISSVQKKDDIHMGEPGFLHKLLRKKKLESIFLFVTSGCNSKCRTCFYHDKLNDNQDMTFEQIKTMSETSPKFDKLWLSGGEPFMRKDLFEIVEMFYRNNDIKVINMPTNGLLTDRIESVVAKLLDACPDLTMYLNFSLDGLGKTHDANRGVPNNFKKTIASMELMRKKYGNHKRLMLNVATVVTPDAYDEMFDLGAYLLTKDLVDTHFFEIVRGDPKDATTKRVSPEDLKLLREKVMPLFSVQAENMFKELKGLKKWFGKLFFNGFIKFMNDVQDSNYTGPCDWKMRCIAGETTIVFDHNGDFRSCEMRPPIGNISDYNYNVTAALNSDVMKKEIEEIGGGAKANCWCTHGCWVLSSIKFSPRAILFRIPAAYRRYKKIVDKNFTLPVVDVEKIENY